MVFIFPSKMISIVLFLTINQISRTIPLCIEWISESYFSLCETNTTIITSSIYCWQEPTDFKKNEFLGNLRFSFCPINLI